MNILLCFRDNKLHLYDEINYWFLFFGTLPRASIPDKLYDRTCQSSHYLHGSLLQQNLIGVIKRTPFSLSHICRVNIRLLFLDKIKTGGTLSERITKYFVGQRLPRRLLEYLLYINVHPVLDGFEKNFYWPEIFDSDFKEIYNDLPSRYSSCSDDNETTVKALL